jgi:hypothetical protein
LAAGILPRWPVAAGTFIVRGRIVATYNVLVNLTLSIDEDTFVRARNKAALLGKSLNQLILDYLQDLASIDNRGQSIEEFRRLSGQGNSRGWHFDRNEIHERS